MRESPPLPVEFSVADDIAHLELTAPDTFNALTPAHWQQMAIHLERLLVQAQARVLVLSAQGKHSSRRTQALRRLRVAVSR